MALVTEAQFHGLVVDDSLIDRKLIERLLKTSSFLVTTVDSGSKALEFLGLGEDHCSLAPSSSEQHDAEVNMVITDYCMPEMTGYDLLKKIKESSAFRNTPVVFMSSENVPARISGESRHYSDQDFKLFPKTSVDPWHLVRVFWLSGERLEKVSHNDDGE
ncbi:Two-component response regulator ARR8 [Platanthera guangdongensis]|uniref:Two-component response regulator ARR8 n=1 Tax=Platanthera guangdongensis TaxID=2320717 RepID=A0ABR2M1D0_9ASPA